MFKSGCFSIPAQRPTAEDCGRTVHDIRIWSKVGSVEFHWMIKGWNELRNKTQHLMFKTISIHQKIISTLISLSVTCLWRTETLANPTPSYPLSSTSWIQSLLSKAESPWITRIKWCECTHSKALKPQLLIIFWWILLFIIRFNRTCLTQHTLAVSFLSISF